MKAILCADDFALSPGVSDAILELVHLDRLSATSVLSTSGDWPRSAKALAAVRDRVAVGLHLNLTLGSPLGSMPRLAPDGVFPSIRRFMCHAFANGLDHAELEAEIRRQLSQFVAHFGHEPDFIDGHEHVHVLPEIRQTLLRVICDMFEKDQMLVRDPSDEIASIVRRNTSIAKAMTIAALARGFGHAASRAGVLTNASFAGFTSFRDRRGFPEFDRFFLRPSRQHLIMCHPGFADRQSTPELHMTRRFEEFTYLRERHDLPDLLWFPRRSLAALSVFSVA